MLHHVEIWLCEAVEICIATVGYALKCTITKTAPDSVTTAIGVGSIKQNSDAYVALRTSTEISL